MPKKHRLLGKHITYSIAKEEEVYILQQLSYYDQQVRFFAHLESKRSWMKAIVAYHLGLLSAAGRRNKGLASWKLQSLRSSDCW